MSPFFVSVINTVLHLKRICPKCKREQIVPVSKRGDRVRCKFCGADVPPRK